jgi:hypothetical protein
MMSPRTPSMATAEEFASRGDVSQLLQRLVKTPSLQKAALAQPDAFLRKHGIDLPKGFDIRFGPQLKPRVGKPGPGWEPYSIRMTKCRTFWVQERNKPPHQETVCFGFELIPNRPPGPRG